jgi:hypothetical protein
MLQLVSTYNLRSYLMLLNNLKIAKLKIIAKDYEIGYQNLLKAFLKSFLMKIDRLVKKAPDGL